MREKRPLRFMIVGSGWRAMFYVRIAERYPELFRLTAVVCRSREKEEMLRQQGIFAVTTPEEGEKTRPDFVVVAVTKTFICQVTEEWALRGFPVLCETPAGMNTEELGRLWQLKQERGARIQVAEQYHRYPVIRAGLEAVRQGKLGEPCGVRLSVAHDYHGVSLIRRMLGGGLEPVKMWGSRYRFSVTETDSRNGPVTDGRVTEKERTCITMEFASGKAAFYDFSGVQYHSFIRSRHVNVQGRDGEWNDTMLRYLGENYVPVEERLLPLLPERYRELETRGLRERGAVWDPVLHLEEAQDEYAIASMMFDMGEYLDTGREVYPLAEALEDAYLWLLMERAVKRLGVFVSSEPMPWHGSESS